MTTRPSAIAALNRAIADAHFEGPSAGSKRFRAITARDPLADYPFFFAALGELEFCSGRHVILREHFQVARGLHPTAWSDDPSKSTLPRANSAICSRRRSALTEQAERWTFADSPAQDWLRPFSGLARTGHGRRPDRFDNLCVRARILSPFRQVSGKHSSTSTVSFSEQSFTLTAPTVTTVRSALGASPPDVSIIPLPWPVRYHADCFQTIESRAQPHKYTQAVDSITLARCGESSACLPLGGRQAHLRKIKPFDRE
jgi:hypothetical protein